MSNVFSFYRGKTVFLTGHTGFKGTWLSLWLKQLGANVIGYALAPAGRQGRFFRLVNSNPDLNSEFGDILDFENLKLCIGRAKPDIVFHLAAQSLVLESLKNPQGTFNTNVMGTVNLLEAIRQCSGVRAVVNVTTDKCYHNNEWHWPYRETDNLGGKDPYSSSKAASELVTTAYRMSYFNDLGVYLASARAGNVIGGGDFNDNRLIPDIVESILTTDSVVLRNPNSIRPWQHVFDALLGYLTLAKKLYEEGESYAQAYNFGPNNKEQLTVLDITRGLVDRFGKGRIEIESRNKGEDKEAKTLMLDPSKAMQTLKWEALLGNEQMLDYTAEWYQNYIEGRTCMETFSLKQIDNYSLLVKERSSKKNVLEPVYG